MVTVSRDPALWRSRLLLRASEALDGAGTAADVLAVVPALLCDAMAATYVAVVPVGAAPDAYGGAVVTATGVLTGAAVRDHCSLYCESTMDLMAGHAGLAEEFDELGWQAVVCAPLPEGAGAVLLAWDDPQRFSVFDRALVATLALHIGQALGRVGER